MTPERMEAWLMRQTRHPPRRMKFRGLFGRLRVCTACGVMVSLGRRSEPEVWCSGTLSAPSIGAP